MDLRRSVRERDAPEQHEGEVHHRQRGMGDKERRTQAPSVVVPRERALCRHRLGNKDEKNIEVLSVYLHHANRPLRIPCPVYATPATAQQREDNIW